MNKEERKELIGEIIWLVFMVILISAGTVMAFLVKEKELPIAVFGMILVWVYFLMSLAANLPALIRDWKLLRKEQKNHSQQKQ